jgi:hypothetical protein
VILGDAISVQSSFRIAKANASINLMEKRIAKESLAAITDSHTCFGLHLYQWWEKQTQFFAICL